MTKLRIAFGAILLISTAAAAATLDVPSIYPTIQAAVDVAAPGDTVLVAPGAYEEQVVVTTDLVLRGAGPDATVIQAPTDLPHSVGDSDYRPIVSVEAPAESITVTGLSIDGLGRGPETGRLVGLLFASTGGRVVDVAVTNVHDTPLSLASSGIGIIATQGPDGADRVLELTDVRVTRFQKTGVVIWGWGYTADITRLDIDTDGLFVDTVQNGIELGFETRATLTDCSFRNLHFSGLANPDYTSCAILGYYTAPMAVRDCTMIDCQAGIYLIHTQAEIDRVDVTADPDPVTYCHGIVSVGTLFAGGKSDGGKVDLPRPSPLLDAPPPAKIQTTWSVNMRDCVLDGRSRESSRGIALRATTAEAQVFTAERCRVIDWETGVMSLEALPSAMYVRLDACRLAGNDSFGAYASTLTPLDARGCWWGDPTGPYHPWGNPYGLANSVSDNVLYDPWLKGNLAPLPLPQVIALDDLDGTAYADTVCVEYLGGGADQLYGYSAEIQWDPAVLSAVSIARPSRGAFADAVLFQVLPTVGGAVIDAALGGDVPGIDTGPLFQIRFEAVDVRDWTSVPLTLHLHHARNRHNEELSGFAPDAGEVIVDLVAPVISSVKIANQTLDHTDLYAKDTDLVSVYAQVTDGDPDFGVAGIRGVGASLFGGAYLYFPPDSYVGNQAIWAARPALLTPSDGLVVFAADARDPSGNLAVSVWDSVTADNTAPAPVVGLDGSPAHNQVHLRWDDAALQDLNYRRTVVRAAYRGDYPLYDGAPPTFPATPTDGEPIYAGLDTAVHPTFAADGSERDILFVSAMVEDMAGNASPVNSETRLRVTNYRLGDVRGEPVGSPGDGVIDLYDMTRLGDTFGLAGHESGFDAECDIAPAASGIPQPDALIDLDDLMLFADQFDLDQPPAPVPDAGDPPLLRWQQVDAESWALVLVEPCPRLKGLSLDGADLGGDLQLTAGALLRSQPGPWFLHPGRGGCEAHLAVLGRGAGVIGSGELLRLTAAEPVSLPTPSLLLRDVDNQPLVSNLPTAVDDPTDTPAVFRSGRPYPNPFNPSTTIAFDLPRSSRVRITVYGLDGRLVQTLLAADMPAGRHTARWDGRDRSGRAVAAGTYLYRLDAGAWTATGKLELIK